MFDVICTIYVLLYTKPNFPNYCCVTTAAAVGYTHTGKYRTLYDMMVYPRVDTAVSSARRLFTVRRRIISHTPCNFRSSITPLRRGCRYKQCNKQINDIIHDTYVCTFSRKESSRRASVCLANERQHLSFRYRYCTLLIYFLLWGRRALRISRGVGVVLRCTPYTYIVVYGMHPPRVFREVHTCITYRALCAPTHILNLHARVVVCTGKKYDLHRHTAV